VNRNFVAYYRVSTQKQGRSGLGLDVQREKVHEFLDSSDALIQEFVEIESGNRDSRVELEKAIRLCVKTNASLLIHKLDRFSRRVSFISSMMDRGIKLTVVDLPNASDFQLHIFAALSQEERRLISERTRSALKKAKERGVKLGVNGRVLALENKRNAAKFADSYKDQLLQMFSVGMGYSRIASELNKSGCKSFRGGVFYASTVKNMLTIIQSPS